MSNVRVELNSDGVRALLKSPEMQAMLESEASRMASATDSEYDVYVASTRAVAEVRTTKFGDNSLLKAVR